MLLTVLMKITNEYVTLYSIQWISISVGLPFTVSRENTSFNLTYKRKPGVNPGMYWNSVC